MVKQTQLKEKKMRQSKPNKLQMVANPQILKKKKKKKKNKNQNQNQNPIYWNLKSTDNATKH